MRSVKPTREEKKAATRAALVAAAADVFRDKGFRAASLDEIGERVGMTKGAVYSQFGSKEALLLAACQAYAVSLDLSAFDDPSRSLDDQLRQFVTAAVARLDSPEVRDLTPLELEVAALAVHDPRAREWIATVRRNTRLGLAVLLRRRCEQLGTELPLPYIEMATVLDAVMRGLALHYSEEPEAAPPELFANAMSLAIGASARRSRKEIELANAKLDDDLTAAGLIGSLDRSSD